MAGAECCTALVSDQAGCWHCSGLAGLGTRYHMHSMITYIAVAGDGVPSLWRKCMGIVVPLGI